jgi:hypothetical protein
MWQRITNPDVLIFLQVSYHTSQERRPMNWSEAEYNEQQRRLAHAHENADLLIETDDLSIQEVCDRALAFIKKTTR